MLSDQEQKQIIAKLFTVSQVCNQKVEQATFMAYAKILAQQNLSLEEISDAIDSLMFSLSPGSRFPSLKDILKEAGFEKFDARTNDRDDASIVASKIISAVASLGRYAEPHELRNAIGELGLEVIRHKGGWARICDTMEVDDERTWEAQLRNLAESCMHRVRRGLGHEPPSLPGKSQALIDSVVNKALEGKRYIEPTKGKANAEH